MSSSGNYMSSSGYKRKPSDATSEVPEKIQAIQATNPNPDPIIVQEERNIEFEDRKQELSKNYTEVEPSDLVSPTTDPVFVKNTWADDPIPKEFEKKIRELLQTINSDNTVIVAVQCHGGVDAYEKINTEQYGDKSITIISGVTYGQPSFATTPAGCFGIFTAPLSSLNYASGNYKNAGVGYFLDPYNHEQIVNALKTGNIDLLFKYTSNRELNPEYNTCGLGLPGCCPNYLLDFNPGVDSWAAFVATSEANQRNIRSLMAEKDTRSRILSVSNPTEKMEASLLNDTYELFGEEAKTAETTFKQRVKENDGKMYVSEFFKIIKQGFPGKTIICFFDVCSAFFPNIVGKVKDAQTNTETIVNLPIDQKLDKDKPNMNTQLIQDPDYIIFQEYLTACAKFKTIRFPTIYRGIRFGSLDKPTYMIEYSPIVKIAFETTKKMFDVVKKSYEKCSVKDTSFIISKTVKTEIDAEIVFAAKQTDTGSYNSDSQPQDVVPYLIDLKPVVVCKPTGVFSNVAQFIRNFFKKQPGCNNIFKYTLKPGEKDPIVDDIGPSFPPEDGIGSGSIQGSSSIGSSSSAAGGGGGSSIIGLGLVTNPSVHPTFSGKAGGSSIFSMDEGGKGGSRRRPKNKPKNRKTKNKKQRKTKNRKNRQPNRNKTRRH